MDEVTNFDGSESQVAYMFGQIKGELKGVRDIVDRIEVYTEKHEKEHSRLWQKVDKHGRVITSITAIVGFVMFVAGTWWKLFKDKFIGG